MIGSPPVKNIKAIKKWPLAFFFAHYSHITNDIINVHAIKAYRHLLLMTGGLLSASRLYNKGRHMKKERDQRLALLTLPTRGSSLNFKILFDCFATYLHKRGHHMGSALL